MIFGKKSKEIINAELKAMKFLANEYNRKHGEWFEPTPADIWEIQKGMIAEVKLREKLKLDGLESSLPQIVFTGSGTVVGTVVEKGDGSFMIKNRSAWMSGIKASHIVRMRILSYVVT